MVKKSIALIILVLLSLFMVTADDGCIYYFYGTDCVQCQETTLFLEQLQKGNPNLEIQKFESYYNRKNAGLLEEYFAAYNINEEKRGIPIIFLSDSYLIGAQPIFSLLEAKLAESEEKCPTFAPREVIGVVGELKESANVLHTIGFLKITGDALKQAFRPATLALFLILLILLTSNVKRRIEKGIFFVSAVWLALILFGLGGFSFFNHASISLYFYKTTAVIGLIFALWHIRIFFHPDGEEKKAIIVKAIDRYTSPLAMAMLGFAAALLALGGSSKIFTLLRILYEEDIFKVAVLPMIIYYCVISLWLMVVVIQLLRKIKSKNKKEVEENKDNSEDDFDDQILEKIKIKEETKEVKKLRITNEPRKILNKSLQNRKKIVNVAEIKEKKEKEEKLDRNMILNIPKTSPFQKKVKTEEKSNKRTVFNVPQTNFFQENIKKEKSSKGLVLNIPKTSPFQKKVKNEKPNE